MGVCTHRRNELNFSTPTTLLGSNFLCKRVAISFAPSLPRTAPIRNSWLRERRDGSGQSLSQPLNPKLSSCSASSNVPPLILFPQQVSILLHVFLDDSRFFLASYHQFETVEVREGSALRLCHKFLAPRGLLPPCYNLLRYPGFL